jgi:hypothetical protein
MGYNYVDDVKLLKQMEYELVDNVKRNKLLNFQINN